MFNEALRTYQGQQKGQVTDGFKNTSIILNRSGKPEDVANFCHFWLVNTPIISRDRVLWLMVELNFHNMCSVY
jgi:hypothetical protein